jgi:hypothetical protein
MCKDDNRLKEMTRLKMPLSSALEKKIPQGSSFAIYGERQAERVS